MRVFFDNINQCLYLLYQSDCQITFSPPRLSFLSQKYSNFFLPFLIFMVIIIPSIVLDLVVDMICHTVFHYSDGR